MCVCLDEDACHAFCACLNTSFKTRPRCPRLWRQKAALPTLDSHITYEGHSNSCDSGHLKLTAANGRIAPTIMGSHTKGDTAVLSLPMPRPLTHTCKPPAEGYAGSAPNLPPSPSVLCTCRHFHSPSPTITSHISHLTSHIIHYMNHYTAKAMAKKKPRRAKRAFNASEASRSQHEALVHRRVSNTTPNRTARAHEKHLRPSQATLSPPSNHPTLATRFHALPPELREHIFAQLLIQPNKWHTPHLRTCPLRTSNEAITPALENLPYTDAVTCARCCWGPRPSHRWFFRGSETPGWHNPWRSQYAPPVRNGMMCSDCWDEHWRETVYGRQAPRTKSLPCLCARRKKLQVLLVGRQWYEEAARVFYSRNTFAFEDGSTFTRFVANLQPCHRERIIRISLKAYFPPADEDDMPRLRNAPPGPIFQETWESSKALRPVWCALRTLPALSHLELDALFLTRTHTVQKMLRLGLRNLRAVTFVLRRPLSYNNESGNREVWPEFAHGFVVDRGFAAEMGRAIKGERRGWMKRNGELEKAVERQRELYARLEGQGVWPPGWLKVDEEEDLREWERLWWRGWGSWEGFLPRGV